MERSPDELLSKTSAATKAPGSASAAGSGEDAYLLVVEAASSWWLPLPREGSILIGRDLTADVRLSDNEASRRHARVIVAGGEVRVSDLDSRNGTTVNGQPAVGARLLASGDVIGVGGATMVLRCRPGPPPGRVLLEAMALRRRLEEEIARAHATGDPLTVVVARFRALPDREAVAREVDGLLRLIDVAGWTAENELAVLVPGVEEVDARATTTRLGEALHNRAEVGLAHYPDAGSDSDTLIGAARGLARPEAAAGPGREGRIELGERAVIVADPAMVGLFGLIKRLAPSDLPVLIRGETGAGKENAAFALHCWSPRNKGPFIAINCAALPETLVESELFGSEKGAFSGSTGPKPGLIEAADGGTVFFDELGELPRAIQPKLLRVIEEKRVTRLGGTRERTLDVRFVAATNRDIEEEVRAGRFRQDLLFRLNAATVVLPPLRDRPGEIAILSRLFLGEACRRLGQPDKALAPGAMHELNAHSWPGNVRELKNVMDFLAATVEAEVIEVWHVRPRLGAGAAGPGAHTPAPPAPTITRFPTPVPPPPGATPPGPTDVPGERTFVPIADELRQVEQRRMSEALDASGWVQTRAAELIGMPLRTFQQKVKLYGLTRRPEKR